MTQEDVTFYLRAKDEASKEITEVLISADALESSFETLRKSGESLGFDPFQDANFARPLAGIESLVKAFDKLNIAQKAGSDNLLLFRANAAVATAVMAFNFAKAVTGADAAQQELNESLEKSIDLNKQLIALKSSGLDTQLAEIKLIQNPAQQQSELRELLKSVESDYERTRDSVDKIKTDMAKAIDMDPARKGLVRDIKSLSLGFFNPGEDFGLVNILGLSDSVNVMGQSVTEAEEREKALADQTQKLRDELKGAEEAARKLTQVQSAQYFENQRLALKKMNDELFESIETFGMSSDELIVRNLNLQGLYGEELKETQALIDQRRALMDNAEQQRLAAAAKEAARLAGERLVDSLRREAEILKMGSDGAALYRAGLEGVSQAEIKEAEALQAKIAGLNERNKLQAEAQAIIESNKTATEKFGDELARLTILNKSGALSTEEFAKARENLKKRIKEEAGKDADKPTQKLVAQESRLLIRGDGKQETAAADTARNTKEIVQGVAKVAAAIVAQYTKQQEALKKIAEKEERVLT